MADNTQNFALPFPEGADAVVPHLDIENLAVATDASLKVVSNSIQSVEQGTTEIVERIDQEIEEIKGDVQNLGSVNVEEIMASLEASQAELEAAKEDFSISQAEMQGLIDRLNEERLPELEDALEKALEAFDGDFQDFLDRYKDFEEDIEKAKTDIANAEVRLNETQKEVEDFSESLKGFEENDKQRQEEITELNEVRLPELENSLNEGLSEEVTRLEGLIETSGGSTIMRGTSEPQDDYDAEDFLVGTYYFQYDTLNVDGQLEGIWVVAESDSGNVWSHSELNEVILPQVHIEQGTYGDLHGERITANTIQTSSLAVNDWENLIVGSDLRELGDAVLVPEPNAPNVYWAYLPQWELLSVGTDSPIPWGVDITSSGTAYLTANITAEHNTTTLVFKKSSLGIPATAGESFALTLDGEGDVSNVSIVISGTSEQGDITFSERVISGATLGDTFSAEFTVPENNLGLVTEKFTFYINTSGSSVGSGRWRITQFRRKTPGVLIEDGAIKAQNIDVENVFTDEAVVNTLWADSIRARVAELSRVVIASQNLWPDPDFSHEVGYGTWDKVDGGLEKNGSGSLNNYIPGKFSFIPVKPNEEISLSYDLTYLEGNTGRFSLYTRFYNESGTYIAGTAANTVSSVSGKDGHYSGERTAPDNPDVAYLVATFVTQADMPTSTRVRVENLKVNKKIDGSLIVEKSIDTKHLNVTGDMTAALINADKARVIDLIAEDLIADNATLINAAIKNLTVTEKASLVEALVDQLYADEFTARVASMAQAIVGSPNLIPGMSNIKNETPPPFTGTPYPWGRNSGHPSIWIQSTSTDQGNITARTSDKPEALIPLEEGEMYKFKIGGSANKAGTRFYVQLLNQNGNSVGDTIVNGTKTSYLISNVTAGSSPTNPLYYESEFEVPETGKYRFQIFSSHPNGTPNPNSYQWFHGMAINRLQDGNLIVENTIKAAQLDVQNIFSDSIVANQIYASAVRAKLLEADEALIGGTLLKNNAVTTDKIAANAITAGKVAANAITAGKISGNAITADKIAGGAIDGKTITGATITGGVVRTSASGARVQMQNDALTAYNASNTVQARYSGSGIELRPPGGTLTSIGPHIFGSEVITRATNQPWVSGTTIAEGSSNGWSSFLTNATNTTSFTCVSTDYVIDFSFMYIPGGGNMNEANASVLSQIQMARTSSDSRTVMNRTFYTRGWFANTEYPLNYTAKITVPASWIGTSMYPRFQFRSRAVNWGASVHSFIFKATPT